MPPASTPSVSPWVLLSCHRFPQASVALHAPLLCLKCVLPSHTCLVLGSLLFTPPGPPAFDPPTAFITACAFWLFPWICQSFSSSPSLKVVTCAASTPVPPLPSTYCHPGYHTSADCRFIECFPIVVKHSCLELFIILASETPLSPGAHRCFLTL